MATLEAIQSSTPPMPTLACQAHTATVTLTASNTTVHVGDTVTVRVTLNNTGCVGLGLVQFSLHSQNPEQKALFHTDGFMPVNVSYVEAGQTEIAQFVLEALKTGEIELTASVGFEVHLGQPGAAYWGGETSVETLTIRVEPST